MSNRNAFGQPDSVDRRGHAAKAARRDRLGLACIALGAVVLTVSVSLAACTAGGAVFARQTTGGDPSHGKDLIVNYGCGACHAIPGIRSARGLVGPPLILMAQRTYIAGQIPNTQDNLERWLVDPQAVEPGTAMPKLGLSHDQARDIAAYLYSLRGWSLQ